MDAFDFPGTYAETLFVVTIRRGDNIVVTVLRGWAELVARVTTLRFPFYDAGKAFAKQDTALFLVSADWTCGDGVPLQLEAGLMHGDLIATVLRTQDIPCAVGDAFWDASFSDFAEPKLDDLLRLYKPGEVVEIHSSIRTAPLYAVGGHLQGSIEPTLHATRARALAAAAGFKAAAE